MATTKHNDRTTWIVPVPTVESRFYQTNSQCMQALWPGGINKECVFKLLGQSKGMRQPCEIHFISFQNLCILLVAYDLSFPLVAEALGASTRTGKIAVVTCLRYPVLGISVERTMVNLKYLHFMHRGGEPSVWNAWKQGKWNFGDDLPQQAQAPRGQGEDRKTRRKNEQRNALETYQEALDPSNDYEVYDAQSNSIFPNRRFTSLPPWMALDAINDLRSKSSLAAIDCFCVNDMEDDTDAYWLYDIDGNGGEDMWNILQLFRVNAEIDVSWMVWKRDGRGHTFYEFRRAMGRDSHPFRSYLRRYVCC